MGRLRWLTRPPPVRPSARYSSGAYGSGPYETYYSSDITPNVWNFAVPLNSSTEALAAPGYVFGSARCVGGLWSQTTYARSPAADTTCCAHPLSRPARGTDCVQPGAVIHDQAGGLVYSAYEVAGQTMSFERTTYQGNDVIVVCASLVPPVQLPVSMRRPD